MRCFASRALSCVLICSVDVSVNAQQAAPLSKQAIAVRRKVEALQSRAPISVIFTHGDEVYGDFVSSDAVGSNFYDPDRKEDVPLQYADVRKVRDGDRRYNSATERHTDRRRGWIIVAVVTAALGGVIGAAAATKG